MTNYSVIALVMGDTDNPQIAFYPKAAIAAGQMIGDADGIVGRLECSPHPFAEETAEIRVVIESPEAIAATKEWLHQNPRVDLQDDRFYCIKVDS